jgi:hypothetical protein
LYSKQHQKGKKIPQKAAAGWVSHLNRKKSFLD